MLPWSLWCLQLPWPPISIPRHPWSPATIRVMPATTGPPITCKNFVCHYTLNLVGHPSPDWSPGKDYVWIRDNSISCLVQPQLLINLDGWMLRQSHSWCVYYPHYFPRNVSLLCVGGLRSGSTWALSWGWIPSHLVSCWWIGNEIRGSFLQTLQVVQPDCWPQVSGKQSVV